ncbi:MAG TPA: non-homologous end-joining DNA ligase [Alphaproteobacteria bacterium]
MSKIKAPYPGFIEPNHPTESKKVPPSGDWIYEVKNDGYRGQLHVNGDDVRVYTRTGNDWTHRFPVIAAALKNLSVQSIIMDGELAVINKEGTSDFQRMQRAVGATSEEGKNLTYHAFDLLYLNGEDLRSLPLIERKKRLKAFLDSQNSDRLFYLEHYDERGQELFDQACKLNMEGIVAKRKDAPYESIRTENWLKIKCRMSETYPIIAFIERLGAEGPEVAALYIGQRVDGKLLYAGKVPTGYTNQARKDLYTQLAPLVRATSPLDVPYKKPKATWVEPTVLAEINVNSVTGEGLVRAASFKGIRHELNEIPQLAAPVKIKAVAPDRKKLAAYWDKVSGDALPYLTRRPLALVREDNGHISYHRGAFTDIPASVHRIEYINAAKEKSTRVWIDSAEGLQGLVDMGAIEIHPWNATVENIELADQIVFDLDPGPGVEWPQITKTALKLRDYFNKDGFKPWVKLTGSKGIHVTVPLDSLITHAEARHFARKLSAMIVEVAPDQYTITAKKSEREGKIYLDYLRNGRGTTAVGAFSPRALPDAPIAKPVSWRQMRESNLRANSYTIDHPFRLS